ncbi:MAG: carbon-nitrogen hydrolase family protein [Pseudomonadota bacterium]
MTAAAKEQTSSACFTAAAVQLRSGLDVAENVAVATELVRAAAAAGAQYVQTPENTNLLEPNRARHLSLIGTPQDCAVKDQFAALAQELGIWLHIGSMTFRMPTGKVANRALIFSPDGVLATHYDKIHLYDVDLPNGESYRESKLYQSGSEARVIDLPWGRLGVTICYDVRFPGLYRALAGAGAQVLCVPASFTKTTGAAHWHTLLRARAIENGAFVIAAAQGGLHACERETFGHSLIIDPWGTVLAEGDTEPGFVMAEIDIARVAEVRGRVPSLRLNAAYGLAG